MRAAAGATSRARARTVWARAHAEILDLCALLICFEIRVRDRDVVALFAALKLEVAKHMPMRSAR